MNIFKLRPLALGCFAFLMGICISYFLGNAFRILLIVSGIILLTALIILNIIKKKEKFTRLLIRLLPLCVCIVACGTVALCTFSRDERIYEEYVKTEKEVEFLIKEIKSSKEYQSTAIAKTTSEKENFEVVLIVGDDKVKTGDIIKATVAFRSPIEGTIGYNEKEAYLDKGVFLFAECEEYKILSRNNFVLNSVFKGVNSYLAKIVEKSLNKDTAPLVSAMLLGNKEQLDDSITRDFARLGISHILALSGIHMSLITGLFSGFLNLIRMRKSLRYTCLILLISFFICITGFSDSAIRAGLMLIILYTLSGFGIESDGISSLLLSVMLICVIDPYSIFSTSLILSFFAMLACFASGYFTKGVKALYRIRPKFIRGIVYTLITSVMVVVFTLPIMYIKFDYVSIFSPIFNVIFIPFLTLILYLSPFVLIFGGVPYLSLVFKYPIEYITKAILFSTGKISRLDFLTISFTSKIQAVAIIIIAISLVSLLILDRGKFKYCVGGVGVGALIIAISTACIMISRGTRVSVSTYDILVADIIAIESKNEVMIVEVSSPSITTSSQSYYYSSSIGYSDIDTYVMADYGHKMVEAFESISDKALIRSVRLPSPESEKERELYDAIKEIAQEKEIAFSEIEESFDFKGTSISYMEPQWLGRSTKRCVALSVLANNARFTYLGASTYECISYFPGNYLSASDVVAFGSYGPRYHMKYKYNIDNVDYVIFHGESRGFSSFDTPEEKIKPSQNRFIFK